MKSGMGECCCYNVGKDYMCAKMVAYLWVKLNNLPQVWAPECRFTTINQFDETW